MFLYQAQWLRAKACLIFQQRLRERSLADFSKDTANPPSCLKHEKHAATEGNSLSAIPEGKDEQDCLDEVPADDAATADERIRVALEVLLDRADAAAQGRPAVSDEGPNSTASEAEVGCNCKLQRRSSSAPSLPNLDGASCTNQVVESHGSSPMPPSKRQRLDMAPHDLRNTCTVEGQSRFQQQAARRVTGLVKQRDSSWVRSDRQPLGARQVPRAARGMLSPRLVHRSVFTDASMAANSGRAMLVSVHHPSVSVQSPQSPHHGAYHCNMLSALRSPLLVCATGASTSCGFVPTA